MLLDEDRNLKLSDFDYKIKTKKNIAMLTKLYKRLLNAENNKDADIYDIINARIEIFVIDFVYYILICDHELYEIC
jgi:hypothetical protein